MRCGGVGKPRETLHRRSNQDLRVRLKLRHPMAHGNDPIVPPLWIAQRCSSIPLPPLRFPVSPIWVAGMALLDLQCPLPPLDRQWVGPDLMSIKGPRKLAHFGASYFGATARTVGLPRLACAAGVSNGSRYPAWAAPSQWRSCFHGDGCHIGCGQLLDMPCLTTEKQWGRHCVLLRCGAGKWLYWTRFVTGIKLPSK